MVQYIHCEAEDVAAPMQTCFTVLQPVKIENQNRNSISCTYFPLRNFMGKNSSAEVPNTQAVKKCSTFCGKCEFAILFTQAYQWTLSSKNSSQSETL
jgi:hypothetical protein